MELKNLIVANKTIEVEHPYLDGLKVKVCNVSKDIIKTLTKKATTQTFDRKTHRPVEEIDDELFLKLYVDKVIQGWSGFKLEYLLELVPVSIPEDQLEGELEYTPENALDLMKNSSDFDTWISTIIGDVKNFNKSS